MSDLPCKIGDRVWAIRNYKRKRIPMRGTVSEIYYSKDMRLIIAVKHIARGEWGKVVFATYPEAVAAVKQG